MNAADPERYARWFADESRENPLLQAATVVILRDTPGGIETLLMRKSSKIAFGGLWVFPGGRVDAEDHGDRPDDHLAAARAAAIREAKEEADLDVADLLTPFSHWTPPRVAPRRYATWFFLGQADDHSVTIDDGEIVDHGWMTPAAALERRDRGEIEIAPPTFVTLYELASLASVESAMEFARGRQVPFYLTTIANGPSGVVAVWEGDVAYSTGDLDLPGPRHRLVMGADRWELQRD